MEARNDTQNPVPAIPSLLNPKIFIAYINLYIAYRKNTRSTATGMIKNGLGKFVTTLKGEEANEKKIDDQLANLIIELNNTKTFHDWYELIFRVREVAELCKSFSNSGEISLSWLTLHAVANLIIAELHHVNIDLRDEINNLIVNLSKCENESYTWLNNAAYRLMHGDLIVMKQGGRQGKAVIDNNDTAQKLIKKLALLGHPLYINRAQREHLIDHLTITNSNELKYFNCENAAHYAAPLCLQLLFFKALYECKYQKTVTNISFREFYLEAIELSKMEREQSERALQANRDKDAQLEGIVSRVPLTLPTLPPFLEDTTPHLLAHPLNSFTVSPLHKYFQSRSSEIEVPSLENTAEKVPNQEKIENPESNENGAPNLGSTGEKVPNQEGIENPEPSDLEEQLFYAINTSPTNS